MNWLSKFTSLILALGFAVGSLAQDDSSLVDDEVIQGLLTAPKIFRAATKKIEPCLVTIESFGGVSTVQGKIGGIRSQGEGNTTGVVISSDGYVVTSIFNFIRQPPKITVITNDGERRVAEVVGRDNTRNLCVLKIENVSGLSVPEFVSPDEVKVGQWVVSVGVGYGDSNPAVSAGIISAKDRIGGRAIQTDANVSPANYGGPLVDIEGRLVGICVPLEPGSQSPGAGVNWYDSGIGFAVPIGGSERLFERLKAGETLNPGYIGIRPVFEPDVQGAKVNEVIKDAPAEEAGIKQGDMILKIDQREVVDAVSMRQILNRYHAGDSITLTVKRGPPEEPADENQDDKDGEQEANESEADNESDENSGEDHSDDDQPGDDGSEGESVTEAVIEEIELVLAVRPDGFDTEDPTERLLEEMPDGDGEGEAPEIPDLPDLPGTPDGKKKKG